MHIRPERPGDVDRIRRVNQAAFGTIAEADLVDALREQASPFVSLVAEEAGDIVGHILFSPVTLSSIPSLSIMGLAPMAVLPEHQGKGIGSALVRMGLAQCRDLHVAGVVVVGHATYYPRFGFVPASAFGFTCEFEVPDDVFMALELSAGVLRGREGVIRYHPAFRAVE